MQMQLNLHLISHRQRPPEPKPWLDVSEVARGIGFNRSVEISLAFHDAIASRRVEEDEAYDQRLYDALWLAHHSLSLDQRPAFSFPFDFLREDKCSATHTEVSLRLNVEVNGKIVQLRLSPHGQETQHGNLSR
jgi:hypothetical protein